MSQVVPNDSLEFPKALQKTGVGLVELYGSYIDFRPAHSRRMLLNFSITESIVILRKYRLKGSDTERRKSKSPSKDGGRGPPGARDEADFMVRDLTFSVLSFLQRRPRLLDQRPTLSEPRATYFDTIHQYTQGRFLSLVSLFILDKSQYNRILSRRSRFGLVHSMNLLFSSCSSFGGPVNAAPVRGSPRGTSSWFSPRHQLMVLLVDLAPPSVLLFVVSPICPAVRVL